MLKRGKCKPCRGPFGSTVELSCRLLLAETLVTRQNTARTPRRLSAGRCRHCFSGLEEVSICSPSGKGWTARGLESRQWGQARNIWTHQSHFVSLSTRYSSRQSWRSLEQDTSCLWPWSPCKAPSRRRTADWSLKIDSSSHLSARFVSASFAPVRFHWSAGRGRRRDRKPGDEIWSAEASWGSNSGQRGEESSVSFGSLWFCLEPSVPRQQI